jgi:hypothetical protein
MWRICAARANAKTSRTGAALATGSCQRSAGGTGGLLTLEPVFHRWRRTNIEPSRPQEDQFRETLMYRTVNIAIIALAALAVPAGKSFAFSHGGGSTGHVGPPMAGFASSISHVPPRPGRGTATPYVKKLSPKAGAACFRACMHGVSGAYWGNFCDSACFGG